MPNNHSRYLGNSGHYFNNQLNGAKFRATDKQIKFYIRLKKLCKENGIEEHEDPTGRVGFSESIDKLLKLLQEHEVDVKGNSKSFTPTVVINSNDNVLRDEVQVKLTKD